MNEEFLTSFLENISQLLGESCEIVVHDFSKGLEHTVVKIWNGELSGRSEGACPSSLFFEHYPSLDAIQGDSLNYFNQVNGKIFKSSSTFIRNEAGEVTGAVCVNLDVTEMAAQQEKRSRFLQGFSGVSSSVEIFHKNISDVMEFYLKQVQEKAGKPVEEMTKAEKKEALAFLDARGILQIAKSGLRLCRFFDISKYTLYAWLEEIREADKEEEEDG